MSFFCQIHLWRDASPVGHWLYFGLYYIYDCIFNKIIFGLFMIMSTEEINKIKLLVGHYVVMCIGVGVYLLRLVLKSAQA